MLEESCHIYMQLIDTTLKVGLYLILLLIIKV